MSNSPGAYADDSEAPVAGHAPVCLAGQRAVGELRRELGVHTAGLLEGAGKSRVARRALYDGSKAERELGVRLTPLRTALAGAVAEIRVG